MTFERYEVRIENAALVGYEELDEVEIFEKFDDARTKFFLSVACFNDIISSGSGEKTVYDAMLDPRNLYNLKLMNRVARETGANININIHKNTVAARIGLIQEPEISDEGVSIKNHYVMVSLIDRGEKDGRSNIEAS